MHFDTGTQRYAARQLIACVTEGGAITPTPSYDLESLVKAVYIVFRPSRKELLNAAAKNAEVLFEQCLLDVCSISAVRQAFSAC